MGRKRRWFAGLLVGKPDIEPSAPSHVPGVRQGNQPGGLEENEGIVPVQGGAKGTARRSTGISPADREPIDPRMPNLSPP